MLAANWFPVNTHFENPASLFDNTVRISHWVEYQKILTAFLAKLFNTYLQAELQRNNRYCTEQVINKYTWWSFFMLSFALLHTWLALQFFLLTGCQRQAQVQQGILRHLWVLRQPQALHCYSCRLRPWVQLLRSTIDCEHATCTPMVHFLPFFHLVHLQLFNDLSKVQNIIMDIVPQDPIISQLTWTANSCDFQLWIP